MKCSQDTKDSEVNWIGEFPSDWNLSPTLKFFNISKEKVSEGVLPALSVGYMGVVPQLDMVAQNMASGDRKHIKIGDIAINGRSDRMGAVGLSEYEGGSSLVYHVLRPKKELCGKYYHYVFRNKMFSQEFYKRGNGIVADLWSTKDSELKRMLLPTPPKETQEKIVGFLDEKIGNIDALIEKKKRMIELLTEKRSSVITHAVTKGLDPNTKMKDSGVDWIGEIPESWQTKKQKYIFESLSEIGLASNKVSLENIEAKTGKFVQTESDYDANGILFRKHDILFGKLRPYLSKVLLASESGSALGDILVYRPTTEIVPLFGKCLLLSKNTIDYINGSTYGTKMPRVNPDFIRSLHLPYPVKDEQIKISDFLNSRLVEIDEIILAIDKQINLLSEYKSSLIYQIVTGKIEV